MTLDTATGQIGLFEEAEEYNAFTDKFKAKKTTDDCYTPENVYNAVADWVSNEYGVDKETFVRPFWPGGDYQNMKYPDGCVVVDNPPFSIITQVQKYYLEKEIKFFLFAPTLTLFSGKLDVEYLPCGCGITYENGANVNTSFVTNLGRFRVRGCPELYKAVERANKENLRKGKTELPKYSYPDNVITAAMVARWTKYGVEYALSPADCTMISALDSQREQGKAIFGSGALLSDRAAAERAAAERAAATKWALSDREKAIVARLGTKDAAERSGT